MSPVGTVTEKSRQHSNYRSNKALVKAGELDDLEEDEEKFYVPGETKDHLEEDKNSNSGDGSSEELENLETRLHQNRALRKNFEEEDGAEEL